MAIVRLLASSSARGNLFNRSTLTSCKLNALGLASSRSPISIHPHSRVFRRLQSTSSSGEIELEDDRLALPTPPSSLSIPSSPSSSSPSSMWAKFKHHTGLSTLLPEWKLMLSKKDIFNDILAGITVGCVAMPLSLAIALASGVSPEVGLVSAVVGGTVASIFGGAPLGVTGPSLATSVLLASIAATHGLSSLVIVTCITGGLQIMSGVLRLGGLVRFVPQPVISGFTAGVGGVMLFGQLPRVLGISGPDAPGVVEMCSHVLAQLSNIHPASLVLSLGTLATTLLLPRVLPKVPASLVGVAAAAGLNVLLGLGAPVIGSIPCVFPTPSLPTFPDMETMYTLLGSSFALYGLTSLESLLSGSAADKIDKEDPRKHNPNVEMVGQGLSNIAVSCFGGIPVAGAIARTSLNITAGAKTRRAAIVHVGVIGAVFALEPIVSMIPLSALSGILLSVAFRLLNPRELKFLSSVSYKEVIPLAATFGTVLATDLVTGVEVGVLTAVAMQLAPRLPRLLAFDVEENIVKLRGDITFFSASRIGDLQRALYEVPYSQDAPVVLDFSGVRAVDATASEMIVDIIYDMEEKGHTVKTFRMEGLTEELRRVLCVSDSRGLIAKFIVTDN